MILWNAKNAIVYNPIGIITLAYIRPLVMRTEGRESLTFS